MLSKEQKELAEYFHARLMLIKSGESEETTENWCVSLATTVESLCNENQDGFDWIEFYQVAGDYHKLTE